MSVQDLRRKHKQIKKGIRAARAEDAQRPEADVMIGPRTREQAREGGYMERGVDIGPITREQAVDEGGEGQGGGAFVGLAEEGAP